MRVDDLSGFNMSLRLDLRTLTLALRVARRLASGGRNQEGLSLLRELLASLVNSKQFLDVIPLLVFRITISGE